MDDNMLAFVVRTMIRFFEQHPELCPHEFEVEKVEQNSNDKSVTKYYKCKLCGFSDSMCERWHGVD